MATRLEQSFSVKNSNTAYRTGLILSLTTNKKITLVQKKDKSLMFFPLSGMMDSFYESWRHIKQNIQSGNIIKINK